MSYQQDCGTWGPMRTDDTVERHVKTVKEKKTNQTNKKTKMNDNITNLVCDIS